MDDDHGASPAAQDYLTAIHALQSENGQAVATTELADELGVTSASASTMVKRLAERGLVLHVPYRGARLTAAGERMADRNLERRRLLTAFLALDLGMEWAQAERHARLLERGVSPEVEALIAARIGEREEVSCGAAS